MLQTLTEHLGSSTEPELLLKANTAQTGHIATSLTFCKKGLTCLDLQSFSATPWLITVYHPITVRTEASVLGAVPHPFTHSILLRMALGLEKKTREKRNWTNLHRKRE